MKEEIEKIMRNFSGVFYTDDMKEHDIDWAVNAIMELHQQQIKELKEFAEQKRIMNADNPQYVLGYNFAKEELKSKLNEMESY